MRLQASSMVEAWRRSLNPEDPRETRTDFPMNGRAAVVLVRVLAYFDEEECHSGMLRSCARLRWRASCRTRLLRYDRVRRLFIGRRTLDPVDMGVTRPLLCAELLSPSGGVLDGMIYASSRAEWKDVPCVCSNRAGWLRRAVRIFNLLSFKSFVIHAVFCATTVSSARHRRDATR